MRSQNVAVQWLWLCVHTTCCFRSNGGCVYVWKSHLTSCKRHSQRAWVSHCWLFKKACDRWIEVKISLNETPTSDKFCTLLHFAVFMECRQIQLTILRYPLAWLASHVWSIWPRDWLLFCRNELSALRKQCIYVVKLFFFLFLLLMRKHQINKNSGQKSWSLLCCFVFAVLRVLFSAVTCAHPLWWWRCDESPKRRPWPRCSWLPEKIPLCVKACQFRFYQSFAKCTWAAVHIVTRLNISPWSQQF